MILNVLDTLSEPLVWRALKRSLKSQELEIETYDPFALLATSAGARAAATASHPTEVVDRPATVG